MSVNNDTTQHPTPWRLGHYHGWGNSFLVRLLPVVDPATNRINRPYSHSKRSEFSDVSELAKAHITMMYNDLGPAAVALCDPGSGSPGESSDGPGADGLIVGLYPAERHSPEGHKSLDRMEAGMVLRNADGSDGQMSGNGIRCLVHALLRELHLTEACFEVRTSAGLRNVETRLPNPLDTSLAEASVEMGDAELYLHPTSYFEDSRAAEVLAKIDQHLGPFQRRSEHEPAYGTIGNPHLVIQVDDARTADSTSGLIDGLKRLGAELQRERSFYPEGVNVEVISAVSPNEHPNAVDMAVWERGVGITQACGTGAAMVAARAVEWGLVSDNRPVTVRMPGGEAEVTFGRTFFSSEMQLVLRDTRLQGPSVLINEYDFFVDDFLTDPRPGGYWT